MRRLLTVCAILGLIAIEVQPRSAAAATRGRILGVVPSHLNHHAQQSSVGFSGLGNLTYHTGGSVQVGTHHTYAIYWGTSFSPSYKTNINSYFQNVAADSGKTSNVYASDTQYYQTQGGTTTNISYSEAFGGAWTDPAGNPSFKHCSSTAGGTTACLTDADIANEVSNAIQTNGWPTGMANEYFVFLGNGISTCAGSCAFTDFCAYHTSYGSGSSTVLYANMPYTGHNLNACGSGDYPSGDPATDATLSVTSHEANETITDGLGDAWYDAGGNENGDKCAWNFGAQLGGGTGSHYNQLINGAKYELQQEWSNNVSGCVLQTGSQSSGVTQLVLSAVGGVTAGSPSDLTLTAEDSSGAPVTTYTGTVHFTSTDPQATLPSDYTFTNADSGTHTFTSGITFATAGNQTVSGNDAASGLTGTTANITVSPGSVSRLQVSAPVNATTGRAFSFSVTALDQYANTVRNYAGTIAITASDPQGTVPGAYAFQPGDNGTHTFTNAAVLNTPGTQTITATDTLVPSVTGTSSLISVASASLSALLVQTPSLAGGQVNSGTPFDLKVTAEDAAGNTLSSYTGTVHFTSSDSRASLPGNYTFGASNGGTHTFVNGATLLSGGSQTVTSTDISNGVAGLTSLTVNVSVSKPSAPAVVMAVTGDGQATVSWDPPSQNGGSVTTYTVSCTPSCSGATTGGSTFSTTIVGLSNGTSYTFSVTASNSGGSGPASSTSTTPQALSVRYSDTLSFGVSAHDAAGNGVAMSQSGILPNGLTFTQGSGQGTVAGTTTSGAASFPINFTANNGVNGALTTSATIVVTADDALVRPSTSNAHAVRVYPGTATSITLSATVQDPSDGHTGDITKAQPISIALIPVGSNTARYSCTRSGTLGGNALSVSCNWGGSIMPDVYDVHVSVGTSYFTGYADSVLTAYASGGSSGGGLLIGPNGFPATFGYSAKSTNGITQGKLLYLACGDSACSTGGVSTLRSTSLTGLAITLAGTSGRTARLSGTGSLNGIPNYSFTFNGYDGDSISASAASDTYGMQVQDPIRNAVTSLSFNPTVVSRGLIFNAQS